MAAWQPVGNEIIFVSPLFTYDLSVMMSLTRLCTIPENPLNVALFPADISPLLDNALFSSHIHGENLRPLLSNNQVVCLLNLV